MSSFEDFNDPYDGAMKYDPVKLHSLITSHPMKTMDAGLDMVIENCMCELSKYVKAVNGTGRPRNKYKGGEQ